MEFIPDSRKKKAVSGIISAVILFALLFSVGVGFFLTVGNAQQGAAEAYTNRLRVQGEQSLENLTLKAGNVTVGGELAISLSVRNTGGVPSTISSVYVSTPEGQICSASNSSGFLSTSPALNESLPLTLDVGAYTPPLNENIEISDYAIASCDPAHTHVLVSVLTNLGNTFSVYSPLVNSVTFKDLTVGQSVVYQVDNSQDNDQVNENYEVANCNGCVTGNYVGGNLLVSLITATPSPVAEGGTITVQTTVWDYSSLYSASAYVVMKTVGLGASAAQTTPCDDSTPQTISANGGTATFSCSYTASAGSTGEGTVTFEGVAVACVAVPSTAISPCSSGTPANSSETSSNPVQVGSNYLAGAWQPNFYDFLYTSSTSTGKEPIAVIPESDEYVAMYITVTNSYTVPLTVLDASYIQSVSPGVDWDAFLGYGTPSYTGTPSFTGYGCYEPTSEAPVDTLSGQSCTTVQPGQSVTLLFIAGAPSSTSWDWGTSYPGGTTAEGGTNGQIVLDFVENTNGVYASATQCIPFAGLYVS